MFFCFFSFVLPKFQFSNGCADVGLKMARLSIFNEITEGESLHSSVQLEKKRIFNGIKCIIENEVFGFCGGGGGGVCGFRALNELGLISTRNVPSWESWESLIM